MSTELTEIKVDNNVFIETIEDNIDKLLGFYYWKRYVASAFWSNISTPINLGITLLTALTTAQATTYNLFSTGVTSTLSIITFGLTVFNTFFKPHLTMTHNINIMGLWNNIGTDFEIIFYDKAKYNTPDVFIEKYKKIQERINDIRKNDGPDTTNFFTDLIHILSIKCYCCLKDVNWLDKDMKTLYRNKFCTKLIPKDCD
jgi:hypothetical protein